MLKALRSSRSRSKLAADYEKEPPTPTVPSHLKETSPSESPLPTPAKSTAAVSPTQHRRWVPRPLSLTGDVAAEQGSPDADDTFSHRAQTPSLVSDSSTISRSPFSSTSPPPSCRGHPSFGSEIGTTRSSASPPRGESPPQTWIQNPSAVRINPTLLESTWVAMELAQHASVRSALGLFTDVGGLGNSPPGSGQLSPVSPRRGKGDESFDSEFLRTEDSISSLLENAFPLPPTRPPPPIPQKALPAPPPQDESSASNSSDATATSKTAVTRSQRGFKGPVVRLSQVSDLSDLARRRRARSIANQAEASGLPTISSGDVQCSADESVDSITSRPETGTDVNFEPLPATNADDGDGSAFGSRPRSRLGSLPYLEHGMLRSPSTATLAGHRHPGCATPDTMMLASAKSSSTLTPAMKTAKTSLPWLPYLRRVKSPSTPRHDRMDRGAWSTPAPCVPLPDVPSDVVPYSARLPASSTGSGFCTHPPSMPCPAGCAGMLPSKSLVDLASKPVRPASPSPSLLLKVFAPSPVKEKSKERPRISQEKELLPPSAQVSRRPSLNVTAPKRPPLGLRKTSSTPSLRKGAAAAAGEAPPPLPVGATLSRRHTDDVADGAETPAKGRSRLIPHSLSFARLRSRFLGEDKSASKAAVPDPPPASVKARVRWYEKKAQELQDSTDSVWGTSQRMASMEITEDMQANLGAILRGQHEPGSDSTKASGAPQLDQMRLSCSPLMPLSGEVSPDSAPLPQLPQGMLHPEAVDAVLSSPWSSGADESPATTTSFPSEEEAPLLTSKDSPFKRPSAPLPPCGRSAQGWVPFATPSDPSGGDTIERDAHEEERLQAQLRPSAPPPPPAMSFDSLWTMSSAASDEAYSGPDFDVVPSNETGQLGLTIGSRARALSNARDVRSPPPSSSKDAGRSNRWSTA